jgi:hypothetical protein
MAYEETLKSISLDVDSSLGFYTGVPGLPGSTDPNYGKQYCFVKIVDDHKVGLAVAATDLVIGVLQNKPQVPGQAGTIGFFGVSNIMVAGAVTAGDLLAPDGEGHAVTDAVHGKWVALLDATTAGELVPALRV